MYAKKFLCNFTFCYIGRTTSNQIFSSVYNFRILFSPMFFYFYTVAISQENLKSALLVFKYSYQTVFVCKINVLYTYNMMQGSSSVPEIINPVFAKTSPKRSFSMTEYECFGLVFTKTRVYKFGHSLG
jgi:hypothetical protein